jgi:division protein CdvB (Snf7/Vps24/ESCRT-III family)
MMQESEHWFDNVTVSRHMKQLKEAYKVFEKTATEMNTMQQRLESAYDDMGVVLNRYYQVNNSLNEFLDDEY